MKLSDPLFDKPTQLNVRVPLRTRARLDEYLEYIQGEWPQKPVHTLDWPRGVSEVVREALEAWLADHDVQARKARKKEAKPKTTEKMMPVPKTSSSSRKVP